MAKKRTAKPDLYAENVRAWLETSENSVACCDVTIASLTEQIKLNRKENRLFEKGIQLERDQKKVLRRRIANQQRTLARHLAKAQKKP